MIRKVISSRFSLYLGGFTHVVPLILIIILFETLVQEGQIPPMIVITVPFVIMVVLNIIFFSRNIYLHILDNGKIQYGTLFTQEIVSKNRITEVKHLWNNVYKLKLNDRLRLIFSDSTDVDYLKEFLQANSDLQDE